MERTLTDRAPVEGAIADVPAVVESDHPALKSGWRRGFLLAIALVVVVRVLLSVWAAIVLATMPVADLAVSNAHTGIPIQVGTLASPWQREDALWYEKIATHGYDANDGSTAFLPLLPMLMRAVSVLTLGDMAVAGLLVSMVVAVVGLALLYRLAMLDWGERVATRTVVYLALFPTAFFLLSAYTESLFLALTVGVFLFARERKWWWAAGLAALAGLTKAQGALLCLPLMVEYLASVGWKPREVLKRWWEFGVVVVAAPLATLAFFAYVRYAVGDPMFWSERVTAMWGQESAWPWETLGMAVGKVFSEGQLRINTFDLIVIVLFLVLAVGAFRLRASYGVQALTVLVPSLLRVGPVFPLMSVSRYALAAFPCFMALAVWAEKRPRIVHLGMVALWLGLLLVWTSQFVRGYWVG
jgi:hypothetical protein